MFSKFCLYQILRCTYFVYFKSKKTRNYDRFVDPNILGAACLVHSDLRIYRILFFLLDIIYKYFLVLICGLQAMQDPWPSLSDHYILNREWRVTVNQVQTNYHGRPMVLKLVRCDQAVDFEGYSLCVLRQLKPSELYILSCGKGHGLWPRRFPQLRM